MTILWEIVEGAGVVWVATVLLPGSYWQRLAVRNYRGKFVPAGLGLPIALAVIATGTAVIVLNHVHGIPVRAHQWTLLAGASLIFGVGLYDDLSPGGPKGLRGHFVRLAAGDVSSGVVKAGVAVLGGSLVAFSVPGRSIMDRILGIFLIAAATNLWNGLDVSPGRAIKSFLLIAIPFAFVRPTGMLVRSIAALIPAGWFDLRERAMLGDGGANLLGFVIGGYLFVYTSIAGWALGVVALGFVALNLVAETVSLSRIIEATPPLRWFDRLGRLRLDQAKPESGPNPRDPAAN